MALSLAQIKNSIKKHSGSPEHIPLGNNLYLKIPKSKNATFYFRYTYGKERKILTLGLFSPEKEKGFLTIGQAQSKVEELKKVLVDGDDPAHQSTTLSKDTTVNELIEKFLKNKRTQIKNIEIPARLFRKEISPTIGLIRIDKVKPFHVMNIIEDVAASNRPTVANDVLGLLNQLFKYAYKWGYVETIPSSAFTIRDAGGSEKPRKRKLSIQEIETVFGVFRENIATFQTENYLAFAILLISGVRKSELLKAKWNEFDLKNNIWTIPKERTKTGEEDHRVPIEPEFEKWLTQLKNLAGNSMYVFPKRKFQRKRGETEVDTTDTHISEDTINSALATLFGKGTKSRLLQNKFEGKHVNHFTPHDIRRTCRSFLAQCKIPSDVAEKYLGHKLKGVEEIYNQYDFFDERREAMREIIKLTCTSSDLI